LAVMCCALALLVISTPDLKVRASSILDVFDRSNVDQPEPGQFESGTGVTEDAETAAKLNVKRHRTYYQCSPVANVTAAVLSDPKRKVLQPCKVERTSGGDPNAVNYSSSGNAPTGNSSGSTTVVENESRQDLVLFEPAVTYSVKIPLFEWLNTMKETGTDDSPFLTPCIAAGRAYGGEDTNFLNRYACVARYGGKSVSALPAGDQSPLYKNDIRPGFPIQWNGLGCIVGLSNYRELMEDRKSIAADTKGVDPAESVDVEVALRASEAKRAIDSIFKPGEPAADVSKLLTSSQKSYVVDGTEQQVACENPANPGSKAIDTYYNGDVYLSPNHDIRDISTDADLERAAKTDLVEVEIPMLFEALRDSYELEQYKFSEQFAAKGKVVHRNNIGIKAEVTKKVYPNLSAGMKISERYKADDEFSFQPSNYWAFTPSVYEEKVVMHYPWLGQIREVFKRLSLYRNDYAGQIFNPSRSDSNKITPLTAAIKSAGIDAVSNISFGGDLAIPDAVQRGTNYDKAKYFLRNELEIFTCGALDNLKATVKSNTDEKSQNLVKMIESTDCFDTSGRLNDPLQEFLCDNGMLSPNKCEQKVILLPGTPEYCTPAVPAGEVPTPVTPTTPPSTPGTPLPSGQFVRPVDTGSRTGGISRSHPGFDWSIPVGTPLKSIGNCTVKYAAATTPASEQEFAIWYKVYATDANGKRYVKDLNAGGLWGFGNSILLECPSSAGNIYAAYAHMSKINVIVGQVVGTGEVIGLSGHTGHSSGPHLHFELRRHLYLKDFAREKQRGKVYGFYDPVNNRDNDPNYIDPQCLFDGNCGIATSGDLVSTPGTPSTPSVTPQPQVCVLPVPEPDSEPAKNPVISGTVTDISQVIKRDICGSVTDELIRIGNTPGDIGLVNMSTQTGKGPGTGKKYANIYELIKAVAAHTKVPAAKLAAHVHGEYVGIGRSKWDWDLTSVYNGTVDQTVLTQPNVCGCLGPGQFCPGTARGYFMPEGRGYKAVFECAASVGLNLKPGDPINPSTVAGGICGMAVKLKGAAGQGDNPNWVDDAACYKDSSGAPGFDSAFLRNNNTKCPKCAASRGYYGSCSSSKTAVNYCNATCGETDSLYSKYKDMLGS
jgi:hypothetical protein